MSLKNSLRALLLMLVLPVYTAQADTVTVFAAASTQQAVDEVVEQCRHIKTIEITCRAVYAASSTLARQIINGAPADIFISANQKWMQYLSDNNRLENKTIRIIARNHLVAIAPTSAHISISNTDALVEWLVRDRIALGDPAHVPAGIYAKQALISLGVWEQLQPKTLGMPNVRAALAVVARGEANAGIVYATDARVSPDVSVAYTFPDPLHDPILYPMARIAGRDSDATKMAFDLFASDIGRKAFHKAGFDVEVAP